MKKTLNIDLLERIYEDLKIAFIHKESYTLDIDEIEVILDILDEIEEVNK